MKKLILLGLMSACSFTATVYVENDAATADASNDVIVASDVLDAGYDVNDAGNPNAWITDQPNLSLKYNDCMKIMGDSGTHYVEMTYLYDGGAYKSAIPVYLCSTNISDNCNVEQLLISNSSYYTNPPPIITTNPANVLDKNCQLKSYNEANCANGSGIVYDFYFAQFSPGQAITECVAEGGTLYTTMLLFYDNNFQVAIDKNSNNTMNFQCF